MKTTALTFAVVTCALTLTSDLRSQQANPVAGSPLQQLQALKLENAKLLEKQTATLQKLEEMRLQAQQLKSFTKRS